MQDIAQTGEDIEHFGTIQNQFRRRRGGEARGPPELRQGAYEYNNGVCFMNVNFFIETDLGTRASFYLAYCRRAHYRPNRSAHYAVLVPRIFAEPPLF